MFNSVCDCVTNYVELTIFYAHAHTGYDFSPALLVSYYYIVRMATVRSLIRLQAPLSLRSGIVGAAWSRGQQTEGLISKIQYKMRSLHAHIQYTYTQLLSALHPRCTRFLLLSLRRKSRANWKNGSWSSILTKDSLLSLNFSPTKRCSRSSR